MKPRPRYTVHYQTQIGGSNPVLVECYTKQEVKALIWFYLKAREKIAILSGWKP